MIENTTSEINIINQSFENFNIIGVFVNANIVIKCIIVILTLMSIVSWIVIFNKLITLVMEKNKSSKFNKKFYKEYSSYNFYTKTPIKNDNCLASIFNQSLFKFNYYKQQNKNFSNEIALKDINTSIDTATNKYFQCIEKSLATLSTIGSISPFIGLLGTIVGIINSFRGISITNNTSLSTIAPGIAESLLITAMGLMVAIPSIMFYNKFVNDINALSNTADNFVQELKVWILKNTINN